MKPIPIGVIVDGNHITTEEILVWAKSQNLLNEEEVRPAAEDLWRERKGTTRENYRDANGDWFLAEKRIALYALFNRHKSPLEMRL